MLDNMIIAMKNYFTDFTILWFAILGAVTGAVYAAAVGAPIMYDVIATALTAVLASFSTTLILALIKNS